MLKALVILFSLSGALLPPVTADCDALTVQVEVSAQTTGSIVRFSASGGRAPYKIIFFHSSGQLVTEDFDRMVHENITSGDYQCVVIDGANCRKSLTVIVP